jgi:hypothetical protein
MKLETISGSCTNVHVYSFGGGSHPQHSVGIKAADVLTRQGAQQVAPSCKKPGPLVRERYASALGQPLGNQPKNDYRYIEYSVPSKRWKDV